MGHKRRCCCECECCRRTCNCCNPCRRGNFFDGSCNNNLWPIIVLALLCKK